MCVMVEDADFSARQGSSTSQPQGLELSLSFPISVVGTPIVPVSPNCCETLTQGKHSTRDTCVNYFNIASWTFSLPARLLVNSYSSFNALLICPSLRHLPCLPLLSCPKFPHTADLWP